MSNRQNFKYVKLRWWNRPIPLYRKDGEGYKKIGWIWNQPAYIVNNVHYGWIAFMEDQTEERLKYFDTWSCSCCGAEIWGTKKDQIEKFIKEQTT